MVAAVARELDPQSVLLRWQAGGGSSPEIVGHSYDLGLRTSQDVLKHEAGQAVALRVTSSKQLGKRKVRRSMEVLLRSQRPGPIEVA